MGQHEAQCDKWGKYFFVFLRTVINSYGLLGHCLCSTKEVKASLEDKTADVGRGPCGQCVSAAGIAQQLSSLHQAASQWSFPVLTPWSCVPDKMLSTILGCEWESIPPFCAAHHQHHGREEGRPNHAVWKDICTLDDTRFGELELVSSHRLLVSVFPLAPSCGCCLPPLCSLDQDETEWDFALFLLHLSSHASTLDVGLPISIT